MEIQGNLKGRPHKSPGKGTNLAGEGGVCVCVNVYCWIIYGYLCLNPVMHFNENTNMYLFFYLVNVWKKISQSLWGPPLIVSSNWMTWWITQTYCGNFTSLFQGVVQHDYGWIKKQVSPMRSWEQKNKRSLPKWSLLIVCFDFINQIGIVWILMIPLVF